MLASNFVPKEKRRTIVIMSDDIRWPSGVGTQARQIVVNTAHHFNWICVGASINHPENGRIIDFSEEIKKESGVDDASCLIYAYSSYGDPTLLRHIMSSHQISGILHFTDPRFWYWLYDMEYEVRKKVPIMYYAIWDCPPTPQYNQTYYASCDAIFGISKQSHAIHTNVLGNFRKKFPYFNRHVNLKYIPHGINPNVFYPIEKGTQQYQEYDKFIKQRFPKHDFVVLWNNRNARRKQAPDLMVAFNDFFVKARKVNPQFSPLLIMHTDATASEHGTDLFKVKQDLFPDAPILFSTAKLSQQDLNYLYNFADVTVNVASAEGFGLSSAESLMSGTMVLNNVTGGLQDQVGLKHNVTGEYLTVDDYTADPNWISNSKGPHTRHDDFSYLVWPRAHNIMGHPMTPYIYEEYTTPEQITAGLFHIASMTREKRKELGLKGREFAMNVANFTTTNLGKQFIDSINETIENFAPITHNDLIKI